MFRIVLISLCFNMKEYLRNFMIIKFTIIDRPKVQCSDTDLATLKKSDLKTMDERIAECNNNCSMFNRTVASKCVKQCIKQSNIDIKRPLHGCRTCLRDIELCIKKSKHCNYSCDIATLDASKCKECAYMTGCLIGKCINPAYSKDLF